MNDFLFPEVFFHSRGIGTSPVTIDNIKAMTSYCETNHSETGGICLGLGFSVFALLSPTRDAERSIAADVNIHVCTQYVFVCREAYHYVFWSTPDTRILL